MNVNAPRERKNTSASHADGWLESHGISPLQPEMNNKGKLNQVQLCLPCGELVSYYPVHGTD